MTVQMSGRFPVIPIVSIVGKNDLQCHPKFVHNNNLYSFSFIEPAKSSFSNNLQGSNCTVNAQIITNLELAVQKNNSSVTDFVIMLLYKCTNLYEQT